MTAAPDALREQIAEDLLRIGAVVLRPDEPFTWASGLRAPIYCDNRLTLAYPRVRRRITDGLVALLDGVTVDAVAGVATAGIPQAALVAERLGLPMAYVRAEAKGHGRQNRIEGQVKPGQEVVVVEDLLSTGGSAVSAAEALRAATAEPVAVLGHSFWTTHFDADPGVIGTNVQLNRQPVTVVGVADEGSYGGAIYDSSYFAPISAEPLLLPNENSLDSEQRGWLFLIGRRADGVSLGQARAELGLIAGQIDTDMPGRRT
ncbi:MAG: orotate phosphoribosyltransferase, partial [Rhodothermales bacterium]|nr:orotate phosphoribosyltransferase [Rhodothermales bacterium]